MGTPLDEALIKVTGRDAEFVEACAGYWRMNGRRRSHARERVSRKFRLSWHHLELLERHFGARIKAWPNSLAPVVSVDVNRTLPTGDR